jgi:hypothetical protein
MYHPEATANPARREDRRPVSSAAVWPAANLGRLLQRLSLCLQIGLRIVVGRIQMGMPEPASNHGDIDAGSHKADGSRMSTTLSVE